MTPQHFFNLIRRNWLLIFLIPVVTAASIYLFGSTQTKVYSSDMVIYTGIASGNRIDGDNAAKFRSTENTYANMLSLLSSRETHEEVALQLLASHLVLNKHDESVMNYETYERLQEHFPADLRAQLVGRSVEETKDKLNSVYRSSTKNPVFRVLKSEDPVYSELALQNLTAKREGNSDLVRISYTTDDPAVCKQTLEVFTDVFINKYRQLYRGQNESVIGYFDESTKESFMKLQTAQERLQDFQRANGIVDYDTQVLSNADNKKATAEGLSALEVQYAGAVSVLRSLERSLKSSGGTSLKGQEVIRLRNQLTEITKEQATLESLNRSNPNADVSQRIAILKKDAANITAKLEDAVGNYDNSTKSIDGIPVQTIISNYSAKLAEVQDLQSKLEVMRLQKANSESEYVKLAPLADEVRTLRREVEVAEQEYMAQLDGLKQSRLTEQNIELASKLKVIDPPYMPLYPESKQLIIMVILGFLGTLFITSGSVIGLDLLNQKLNKPSLAAKITSFPVLGALPMVSNGSEKQLMERKRAEEQLARQILLKLQSKKDSHTPFVVGIMSSYNGEGKSSLSNLLASQLNNMGIETLSLFPDNHNSAGVSFVNTTYYSPLEGINPNNSIAMLNGKRVFDFPVIIVEFPALLESVYPVSLLQHLDLILLTINSERTWQQADKNMYASIRKVTDAPIEVVLNGVLSEHLEDFIGDQKIYKKNPYRNNALPSHTSDTNTNKGVEQELLNS